MVAVAAKIYATSKGPERVSFESSGGLSQKLTVKHFSPEILKVAVIVA